MEKRSSDKKSFLQGIFGTPRAALEKNRLEAFLDSVPGAYCGWDPDGGIAWNDGFLNALDLRGVADFETLQNRFIPEDAAILESRFRELRDYGNAFQIICCLRGEEQFFRLSGKRGASMDSTDHYDVIWLEDVTDTHKGHNGLKERFDHIERELKAVQDACDSTPFPVWIRDAKLRLTWCNRAYFKSLNAPLSHILQQQQELTGTVVNHGQKEKMEMRRLAEEAQKNNIMSERTGHMVVSGQRRYFRFQEIPQSKTGGYLGMAQDITREEELATEMAHHLSATHTLLDHLHSAIAIFGKEQQLEFYNSSFAALWKQEDHYLNTKPKLGDIMEKLRAERALPEQADFRHFKKSWLDMFTGLLQPFEDMLYLPSEHVVRMLAVAHPLGGLMMTFEDVTSRLQLESSYNTLIAVQKETLDNLAEGVSVFGEDGRLKLWNPSFAALWGFHPEMLDDQPHITKIVEKMKPFFDSGFWPEYYDQLLGLGLEREERAGRLSRADDHVIDYATLPLLDGGVLVTFTDMTDTVHVETALRERNAALETAERLKLDFLANVSYQLRTPLSSIMGFTEMLSGDFAGPLNPQQKEYTENITCASDRLLSLINDILDLSTIEAGYMTLEKTDFDVKDLLSHTADIIRPWARQRKIDVHLDCPKTLNPLHADKNRISQVLLNLLRNAIAFTPDDGTGVISIIAEEDGTRLLLSVQDNGIGIAAEEQQRVLQPFEHIPPAHGKDMQDDITRGAGLGLTIVKNIIELHGGGLKLDSEPHAGTTVTLTLPYNNAKKAH